MTLRIGGLSAHAAFAHLRQAAPRIPAPLFTRQRGPRTDARDIRRPGVDDLARNGPAGRASKRGNPLSIAVAALRLMRPAKTYRRFPHRPRMPPCVRVHMRRFMVTPCRAHPKRRG